MWKDISMHGRQTQSLPWVANEASNAIYLVFCCWVPPSYAVSPWVVYCPHLALQWGVNILAMMHSPFSLVFQLCFIMIGEMSLWALLMTTVKRISMFPHLFVMRCDGVPLSCSCNLIWRSLGVRMKNYGVFLLLGLALWLALGGIHEPEQRICNRCTITVN